MLTDECEQLALPVAVNARAFEQDGGWLDLPGPLWAARTRFEADRGPGGAAVIAPLYNVLISRLPPSPADGRVVHLEQSGQPICEEFDERVKAFPEGPIEGGSRTAAGSTPLT